MPISDMAAVPAVAAEVYRLQPERMIELGIGFGKYGTVCREVLDAMYGRCRPDQWERWIEGVEGFAGYENPAWKVYNRVNIGDFSTQNYSGWPLVLMIDALEHLEKDQGLRFLDSLVASNRRVIVSVPRGCMNQDAVYGNEYERHRATYSGAELLRYRGAVQIHSGICFTVSIPGVR